jgi:broad specificity phosphatase PhoE
MLNPKLCCCCSRKEIEAIEQASHRQKVVYFVRHGQSQWNLAQKNVDPINMLRKVDHGLSSGGIQEAEHLRQQIMVEREVGVSAGGQINLGMAGATIVFSSPLTRAVQTALIGLQDLDVMKESGIRLMKDLREIKNHITSRDTVQSCQGGEIAPHVERELVKEVGGAKARDLMVPIDCSDAVGHWCGNTETAAEIEARQDAVLSALEQTPHHSLVVVGHSLFFMGLFKRCISTDLLERYPAAKGFGQAKMPNCGVVKCAVDFDMPTAACFTSLQLLFGAELNGRSTGTAV